MPRVFLSPTEKGLFNLRRFVDTHTGQTFRYRNQTALAEAIGMAQPSLSNKLYGRVPFKYTELFQLFRVLRATEQDIADIFCIESHRSERKEEAS